MVVTELSNVKSPEQVPVVPVSDPLLTWYVPPPVGQLKETIAAWAGAAVTVEMARARTIRYRTDRFLPEYFLIVIYPSLHGSHRSWRMR